MPRMLRPLPIACAVTSCLVSVLCLAEGNTRSPVPEGDEVEAISKVVQDVYGEDISKAKTPSDAEVVSRKMMAAASDSKPAAKFVLLTTARDFAASAGSPDVCLEAVDKLAEVFDVDGLAMKTEALAKAGMKGPATAAEHVALIDATDNVIQQALIADRYDSAQTLASLACRWARRARDRDLVKRADDRAKEVRQAQAAHMRVRTAISDLAERPGDPSASLAVGKYLCFVKRQWEHGLALLKAGTDPTLKSLATKELAGLRSPKEMMDLADGWWDCAETQAGIEQSNIQSHAATLYRRAMPDLTGLMRAKAEKRVAEAGATQEATGPSIATGMVRGMIGLTEVSGRQTGILFRYKPGMVFNNATIQETLGAHGHGMKGVKITLHGVLTVSSNGTVLLWHRGGSSSGGVHRLYIDNNEIGSIGDDRSKKSVYKVKLKAGAHAVQWVLTGGNFGNSSLNAFTEDGSREIPITCPMRYWEKPKAKEVVDNFHEPKAAATMKIPE